MLSKTTMMVPPSTSMAADISSATATAVVLCILVIGVVIYRRKVRTTGPSAQR